GEFRRRSAAVRQRAAGDTGLGPAGTDPHAVAFALCDRGAAQYPVALGRAESHQRDRLGARLAASRARVAAGGRLGGLRPVAQADVLLLVPAGGHPADPGCTHLGDAQPGSARSAPAAVGAAVDRRGTTGIPAAGGSVQQPAGGQPSAGFLRVGHSPRLQCIAGGPGTPGAYRLASSAAAGPAPALHRAGSGGSEQERAQPAGAGCRESAAAAPAGLAGSASLSLGPPAWAADRQRLHVGARGCRAGAGRPARPPTVSTHRGGNGRWTSSRLSWLRWSVSSPI